MKLKLGMLLMSLGLVATAAAQAPAGAPAGAMGICKDGTYSMQAKKEGACRGHKGVQTWYAADASAAPATKPTAAKTTAAATPAAKAAPAAPAPAKAMPAPTPAASAPSRPSPTPEAAPAAMPAPAATAAAPRTGKRMSPQESAAQKPQAPGGGAGLVWLNTESNVYHCNGDAFYGKTKAGAYMSEADAKAKGGRGDRGKTCAGK
jgi:hypothetical protein